MCYSGRCQYEGHMGDCRVSEYKKIKDLTGHDACYIGGGGNALPEEIEAWEEDYKNGNISKWDQQIRENRLVW